MTNPIISKRDKKKTIRLFLGNSERKEKLSKKNKVTIVTVIYIIDKKSESYCIFSLLCNAIRFVIRLKKSDP